MKNLLATLLSILLVLCSTFVFAKEISIRFAWDANTEPDMAGYALFERQEGQAYDYIKPIDPDCTIVDGECWVDPTTKKNEFPHKFNAPDGVLSKWYWVARARDILGNWSADSNEVFLEVNLTALPVITDFAGAYSSVNKTVDFTWTQTDIDRITSWKIFQSTTSDVYNDPAITEVQWNGTDTTLSVSLPESILVSGEDYYFVVVGFGNDDLFSSNSNEVKIDRKGPGTVIQLRINLQ